MRAHVGEIAALAGREASLIEFGSGSSVKTRILLEHLEALAAYVPVDISAEHLFESAARIRREFPHIEVLPVVADFTQPFALPSPRIAPRRNIVYFPGSTIGNLEHADALDLLAVMHLEAGADGALLIGVDLQKDPAVIEAAYNDAAGVTARFNLNMLRRLNREFGADFDLDGFRHEAKYDRDAGRVVIRLVSRRDQVAHIGGRTLAFAAGDGILTEYSHKYTLDGFAAMAHTAGFEVAKVWTDEQQLFSVQYLIRM
ncbi:MAG TPA: L-histidine N(alpha)-methyltransferase, partial [Woeseiaceae bacterium]|nr:L-histidine N(alpha)-methyltransferase [Woeseiaceae bacterium]